MSTILNVIGAGFIIAGMVIYAVVDVHFFNKRLKEHQTNNIKDKANIKNII